MGDGKDIIERVAQAIESKHTDYHPTPNDYKDMARAAIAAMREPTKEMVAAAMATGSFNLYVWQAMIDASMKGKQNG